MNLYDIGDVIRVRGTFTNSAGVGVDPSSLSLQYRRILADPLSYTTVDYTLVTRVAAGYFYYDLTPTEEGEWGYRWTGTGNNAAAAESRFKIRIRSVG